MSNLLYFQAMKWAAVENEQVVLIVEDYQLLNNSFLQCLNSIIASGNAPGLFTPQEFDQIANNLRNIALQDAFEGSINSYFSYSNIMSCILKLYLYTIYRSEAKSACDSCDGRDSQGL